MSPRLPSQGSDSGQWGQILNDYLSVSHTSNGAIKDNTIGSDQVQDFVITNQKIAANAGIAKTKLAGDVQSSLAMADQLEGTLAFASAYRAQGLVLTNPNSALVTFDEGTYIAQDSSIVQPTANGIVMKRDGIFLIRCGWTAESTNPVQWSLQTDTMDHALMHGTALVHLGLTKENAFATYVTPMSSLGGPPHQLELRCTATGTITVWSTLYVTYLGPLAGSLWWGPL